MYSNTNRRFLFDEIEEEKTDKLCERPDTGFNFNQNPFLKFIIGWVLLFLANLPINSNILEFLCLFVWRQVKCRTRKECWGSCK